MSIRITAELGHAIEEWEALKEKHDEERTDDGDELWDFSLEDFLNGAIEPQEGVVYWIIGDRAYETGISVGE